MSGSMGNELLKRSQALSDPVGYASASSSTTDDEALSKLRSLPNVTSSSDLPAAQENFQSRQSSKTTSTRATTKASCDSEGKYRANVKISCDVERKRVSAKATTTVLKDVTCLSSRDTLVERLHKLGLLADVAFLWHKPSEPGAGPYAVIDFKSSEAHDDFVSKLPPLCTKEFEVQGFAGNIQRFLVNLSSTGLGRDNLPLIFSPAHPMGELLNGSIVADTLLMRVIRRSNERK